MEIPHNGQQVTAKIEIVLLSNGQLGFTMSVPDRFTFNGMIETAKQSGLLHFAQKEAQKVVGPGLEDRNRLKI